MISLKTATLLTPLVFFLHDAEEIITMPPFIRRHSALFPASLQGQISIETAQVAAAMAPIAAVSAVASLLAAENASDAPLRLLLGGRLTNSVMHIGQAVLLHRYTPGVITATLISLPWSLLVLNKMRRDGRCNRRELTAAIAGGAALMMPLAALAITFGKFVFPSPRSTR